LIHFSVYCLWVVCFVCFSFRVQVYYSAILIDFVLRLAWIVTLTPSSFGLDFPQPFFLLGVAMWEVVRRCMWAVLRLEHEHLVKYVMRGGGRGGVGGWSGCVW
jgi:hypothetical protein